MWTSERFQFAGLVLTFPLWHYFHRDFAQGGVFCMQHSREINSEKLPPFCFSVLNTGLCYNTPLLILSFLCVMFILFHRCFVFFSCTSVLPSCLLLLLPFSVLYHFSLCLQVCKCSDIFMLCVVCTYSPVYPITTYGIFKDFSEPPLLS
jgi:hypothetical protein